MKYTITKLIKELKEIKENWVYESDIPTIQNAINDYISENSNTWLLEELSYKIVSQETVIDKIRYYCERYDLAWIQRTIENIGYNCDYYIYEYDYFSDLNHDDLVERLDDLIDTAKMLKETKTNTSTRN